MSKNIQILVVDDNQINRQYFSMTLKKSFVHVDCAENGADAIKLSKKTPYDLILMDIRMPEMDGFETTTIIRQISNYENSIIIATSAENINNSQKEFLFNDFLAKPISPKILLAVVQKHLQKRAFPVEIFNQETALKYAFDDTEIMQKIVAMFILDLPVQVKSLIQAIDMDNQSLCLQTIHKLQGSCQTCGADKLNFLCEKLSIEIKSSNYQAYEKTIQDVKKSAQEFIQLLD